MKRFGCIVVAIALFAASFAISCGRDETPCWDARVVLAWRTETPASQATRATAENTWIGGEQVWVCIDDREDESFIVSSDGTLAPVRDMWWYSQTQTLSARGWYPDPVSWNFPVDQSGGLQAADFVFASTVTGIKYNNYDVMPLKFRHLTAKVSVNITAGTDIVGVSDATVVFYGYTSGAPDTEGGAIVGYGNGTITPQRTVSTDSYTALLIPRDMTGMKFVKVTLGGYDYYYTPATDEAVLEQGKAYTYNITVHKTRLTVTIDGDGATWDPSGGGTVTATPVPEP